MSLVCIAKVILPVVHFHPGRFDHRATRTRQGQEWLPVRTNGDPRLIERVIPMRSRRSVPGPGLTIEDVGGHELGASPTAGVSTRW